jgi:hypothetical protein
MNKSTFFTGQPIFSQLLRLMPKDSIARIATDRKADYYCKRFNTYEHLVAVLYSVFNNCNSLREITTGMLASEQRLSHLGIRFYPRRSTLSDANNRRDADVFGRIYEALYKKYTCFLSDSRKVKKNSRTYLFDATTISLFQEVLRTGGKNPVSGKRKGGIKVHTLVRSDQDVPCMIRYSSAAANDSKFLKEIHVPKGSIIVFDRGYYDYITLNRFSSDGVTWVTRRRKLFSYDVIKRLPNPSKDAGIISDKLIRLGHRTSTRVQARIVKYRDPLSGERFEFLTNNRRMNAITIANLYKQRWQIEILFKRLKQNYPLKYFLGDSENAIKIQIWCSLIADLLLKVIKKTAASKWSFSNLAAMIRLHLMTYIDLLSFLKSPEKALIKQFYGSTNNSSRQLSLIT